MKKLITASLFLLFFLIGPSIVHASPTQNITFDTAITGNITPTNDQDTYKIALPKAGKININMSTAIYEVNMDLEDANGNKALQNDVYYGSEQTPKTLTTSADLEAGTYYLKVWKYGSNTGTYTLTVNFTDANNNDVEPNNGTLTAQPLTLNSSAITGYISWNDNQDVYKVVLPKAGKIDINMSTAIYEVNMDLEDANGNKALQNDIYYGSEQTPKTLSTSADLEAGTYYLKVWKYGSNTGTYTLTANFTVANNNDIEPNNGTLTAQPLTLNSSAVTGYISWNDSQDVYKVVLPKAGKININMSTAIYEVNMDLEDASGNKALQNDVYYGSEQTPKILSTSADLEAGTYYLKVWKYGSNTGTYTLATNFTAANNNDVEPNNGTLTAQPLTLNSSAITGYISWNDDQDVYKVVLAKAGKIDINMSTAIYEVNMDLEDANGDKKLYTDLYYGSEKTPKTLLTSADLEAGTYYLKVWKYGSNTGVYTLAVTAIGQPVQTTTVSLDKQTLSMNKGDSPITLKATVSSTDGVNNNIIWTSSNSNIATVDQNGLVTPVGLGTATITVTTADGGSSSSCNVTVSDFVLLKEVSNINVDKDWIIAFKAAVDEKSLNNSTIFVLDKNNELLDINLSLNPANDKQVIVKNNNLYKSGETYRLYITKDVKSKKGKNLPKSMLLKFTIK